MESVKEIYLLGVGHNTAVFIDLAEHCGYQIAGLYHYNEDRTDQLDHGFPILGSFIDLLSNGDLSNTNFLLTMADNKFRTELAKRLRILGGETPTLIHPTAVISRFAKIGGGVCISAFSYVQADANISDDTIILSGVNISHNTSIGKGCFIAGGTTIGAYTVVGEQVFFGQGVLTISGKVKSISAFSYIGAGSLITKSIDTEHLFAGRPAKRFK